MQIKNNILYPLQNNLLTLKLKNYGIKGKTNEWIHSFLSNRTQTIVLEGVSSGFDVQSRVTQGSVLEPSLFLFYINDMPVGPNSTIHLFDNYTIANQQLNLMLTANHYKLT